MIYDVLIVGAGPAGLGMALELKRRGIQDVLIVDGSGVGASFAAWPRETRFITPSFPAHEYGCPDLNAIEADGSVATRLGVEHPSGIQYACYLNEIAEENHLHIEAPVRVLTLYPGKEIWEAETTTGLLKSHCVVWATGEYTTPRIESIQGLNACDHYSDIQSWEELAGDHFLILGGGESGIDAACNLVDLGKTVSVLDRSGAWQDTDADPSWTLSPVTRERLRQAQSTNRIRLESGIEIIKVEAFREGYRVLDRNGMYYASETIPINCLGFEGGAGQIAHLWEWSGNEIVLTGRDESTYNPGLFLVGPQVRQPGEIFCFIYKFRTRFPLVAEAIQHRLNPIPSPETT